MKKEQPKFFIGRKNMVIGLPKWVALVYEDTNSTITTSKKQGYLLLFFCTI